VASPQGNFRGPIFRQGRQHDDAAAPAGGYSAGDAPIDSYGAGAGAEEPLGGYGADAGAQASYGAGDDPAAAELAALAANIPGVPGEDYPIFAEVPETGFACEGQVPGGYYADPEAECQAFHICTEDGLGGLSLNSFLCPNGTIFNQNYFICDWWFNFDCAEAEDLYSINDDIAAERAEIDAAAADAALDSYGAGEGAADSYGGPTPAPGQAEYNDREGRSGRRFSGRRG